MKNTINFTIILLLSCFCVLYAQNNNFNKKATHQLINYYPTEKKSITIFDRPNSKVITLVSPFDFDKVQLIDSQTKQVIYTSDSKGKIATILKSKLERGVYVLQIYRRDKVINADLYIESTNRATNDIAFADAIDKNQLDQYNS